MSKSKIILLRVFVSLHRLYVKLFTVMEKSVHIIGIVHFNLHDTDTLMKKQVIVTCWRRPLRPFPVIATHQFIVTKKDGVFYILQYLTCDTCFSMTDLCRCYQVRCRRVILRASQSGQRERGWRSGGRCEVVNVRWWDSVLSSFRPPKSQKHNHNNSARDLGVGFNILY